MSISGKLKKELDDFEKEANAESNKTPDASPWSLLHLSSMKRLWKAFNIAKELLVNEKVKQNLKPDMTIEEKHDVESNVIQDVEKKLDESVKGV